MSSHWEVGIVFNSILDTTETLCVMAKHIEQLLKFKFKCIVILETDHNMCNIAPLEGFNPVHFVLFMQKFVSKVGKVRGIVEILERKEYVYHG